jgi:sorbitol-specific phosphotransferase system component IIBC
MGQMGHLTQRGKGTKTENPSNKKRSDLILTIGVLLGIFCLIYMMLNLEKSDQIIKIWLPFMATSIYLVFMSQLIKWTIVKSDNRKS